jgi:membrane protease YdiL (CAAX protease family)
MKTDDRAPPLHYLDWSNRGRPALWRYAIAMVLALILWIFGPIPVIVFFGYAFNDPAWHDVVLQYTFLPGFLGVLLITRLLLGRPAYSVFSAIWPPRFADYFWGVLIGWSLGVIMTVATLPFLPPTYQGWDAEVNLGLPLILALLIGFMIQTGFEELFFRGLLMQATRRITRWLPLVIGLQALLFAAPHFGNVGAWTSLGPIAVLPYVIVAASWGWVAWRTGSVLMSMGLHFANNTFNVLAVGTTGDILVPYAPFIGEMPSLPNTVLMTAVQALVTVIAVEVMVRRRSGVTTQAH